LYNSIEEQIVKLATAIALTAYGTSESVRKAWDTRGRGRAERPHVPRLDRSKLAKQFYVPVTSDKIRLAGESVAQLAAAIGGTVTPDHHPFDILYKGTKIGIEVKRFLPGRKNLKVKIHSGGAGEPFNSKEKKVEFADKSGMKQMWIAVHNTTVPGKESWHIRRAGDRGDPRADKNDIRTGWNYHLDNMQKVKLQDIKRYIK
jgi:hypothetical protein